MQPLQYPTDELKGGLVGILPSNAALLWFSPLVMKNSPLLQDFDDFLEKITNVFGETDKTRMEATKNCSLQQQLQATFICAAEFLQLTCDIDWNNNALIGAFRWGLRDDVKDLLLNLPNPITLSKTILQAMHCDNHLFERPPSMRTAIYNWTISS